jgi:hypothetical protein
MSAWQRMPRERRDEVIREKLRAGYSVGWITANTGATTEEALRAAKALGIHKFDERRRKWLFRF